MLVVLGMGELGALYATAALKLGLTVTPGTRSHAVDWTAVPRDTPVLVAVGEDAVVPVLRSVPLVHRDNVILLQNELFPQVWKAALVEEPTVMVPWFSKKKGKLVELSRPTLMHGRWAPLLEDLHRTLGIPSTVTGHAAQRDEGLVAKYTFILTINVLGVAKDLTLGTWLQQDAATVHAVLEDARTLGEALLGARVDENTVRTQVLEAFAFLANHPARGRTAAARVQRARAQAQLHHVTIPAVERLSAPV